MFACRCLVLFSILLCGCGAATYPVHGVVQFEDGKPATQLAGGFVSCQGIDREVSAQGEIRSDGTFELSTLRQGDGAYPGEYRVMVTPPPFHGSESQRIQRLVDPQFSDPKRSPLQMTVEAKRNQVTVEIQHFKQADGDRKI